MCMHACSFTIHILLNHRKPSKKRGFHFHRRLDHAVDAPGLENGAGRPHERNSPRACPFASESPESEQFQYDAKFQVRVKPLI